MSKKNIAIGLASAFKEIHSHQKIPVHETEKLQFAHKHLSSHNVMIKCLDQSSDEF